MNALGHQWGAWKINKKATCTEDGEQEHTCTVCKKVEKQKLPATKHAHTHWNVLEKPTSTTPGKREQVCDDCGKVLKTEAMSVLKMTGNTMCAFGPRIRDVDLGSKNQDLWYMFTPFDASVDGKQTFDLVASNMYIVGTVTVEVKDGEITVDYKLNSGKVTVDQLFFTIVGKVSDLPQFEPEALAGAYGMQLKTPINMAEHFGDDTNLVLYFCSRIDYYVDAENMTGVNYTSAEHKAQLQQMLDRMDH